MKALTLTGYDGVASLAFAELPTPEPGPHDLLVKVAAASVNPVDGKITQGYMRSRIDFALPHVLGRDCAGVVAKVGSAVKTFAPGDAVFGVADQARFGTQAEYVALPATTAARRPKSLSDLEAGSLPVAGLSAWAGLVTVGGLKRGERVLIHAGAGGVGSFAVQFAKHIGAKVTATAGPANVEFVRGLGADRVIDYTTHDFAAEVKDQDMVFDLIGGDVRYRSFRVLKPGGTIVHIAVPPMTQAPPRSDVAVKPATVTYDTALLEGIAALAESKAVKPCVGAVFAFAEIRKAYEHVMTGHARGRVMVDMRDAA